MTRRIYEGEKVNREQKINLILCSDYTIRKLNREYRNIDRATDVLSFPFGEPDFLGEIYISLQRAKVQARRYGISYNDEIVRLFVHGTFHLLGYDHIIESERLEMEKMERKYIKIE